MINTASVPLRGVRTNALVVPIYFVGIDLTDAVVTAAVLQNWDNDPASPEIALTETPNGNGSGVVVGTVTTSGGVPTSPVTLTIGAADMAAIPDASEVGADLRWVWYLMIQTDDGDENTKRRYLEGYFYVGGSGSGTGGTGSVTATIVNDTIAVTVDGATAIGPMVEAAEAAASAAEAFAEAAAESAASANDALLTSGALAGGPCETAATTNITLSGVQNIGGFTGAADQRVLLTAQSTASQNGPWLQKVGSWVRPPDFDTSAEAVQGAFVLVTDGDNRGGYLLTTPDPITLGTTSLNWVQVTSYTDGSVNFGTGGVFDVPTVNGIGNWSRTMFIQPAPATGTQTNSAGGDDEVSISLVIASGKVTNGPTGHANYWDTVMNFGLNQTSSFTPLNTDMPSGSFRIESKFAQGGASDPFMMEFHQSMFPASDPSQEFRLFSGTVPHLISDWDGAGASLSLRSNNFRFTSGVFDDRIKMNFGSLGNNMEFIDSGVGKPHPQLLFGTNNYVVAQQRNAANDAYLPLAYRNSNDNFHMGGGAVYLVTPAQDTPSGSGKCGLDIVLTGTSSANMRAINVTLPTVSGDAYAAAFNGSAVTGNVLCQVLSTGGKPVFNLQVGNGSSNDAGYCFTNQAGGVNWTFGYDNSDADKLKIEKSDKSVGNASNLFVEFDPAINVSYFAKPPKLPSHTVAGLPSAATVGAGAMAFCTNESGGAVPVFSDGTDWRRVTDRAVIS